MTDRLDLLRDIQENACKHCLAYNPEHKIYLGCIEAIITYLDKKGLLKIDGKPDH